MAADARRLGPKARRTRGRLLDATAELMEEGSLLDVTVAEIARRAETSPGTFYHYFPDVEAAALALAERAADEMPALVEIAAGDFGGAGGLARARALVEAFLAHWDAHHAVLLLRNHAADRGDARFHRVRRTALRPLMETLEREVAAGQAAGRVDPALHGTLAAAGALAILESLAAYAREVRRFRATRAELVETCARLVQGIVAGRTGWGKP